MFAIRNQPTQHIKKQRHYFADKGYLVKAMVFPVVMYGCESWTIKKAECHCGTYTQWNITQPLKIIHLNQF